MTKTKTTKGWLKRLQELEPVSSNRRLHELIYTKIIKEAQDFTPERIDEYKENMQLLGEILLAHEDFKNDPLHGEWDDMFGSYLIETEQLIDRAGQFFTPMPIVRFMCELSLSMTDEEMRDGPPRTINDPASGCGRFMIGAAEIYAKHAGRFNFLFVNQDIDQRMYVYSTMNAILYGIPSLNIHGDTIRLKYWEGTVVMKPVGLPTTWKTIPGERVAEIMPKWEEPKRGMEVFIDKTIKERPRHKMIKREDNLTQRRLFDV